MDIMLSLTTIIDGQRLIFLPLMASPRLSPATKVRATTYYYYGAYIEQSTLCAQKPTKCMKHQKQHRRCRRAARALALMVVSLPQWPWQVCDATVCQSDYLLCYKIQIRLRDSAIPLNPTVPESQSHGYKHICPFINRHNRSSAGTADS